MKHTSASLLLGAFLLAGVVAYVILKNFYGQLPLLPSGPAITTLVIAAIEAGLAWTTHNRLRGRNLGAPIEPMQVARLAVLARASSLVGAVLAGAWTAALVYLAQQRGGLDAVSHDRRVAVVGVVSGAALVAAALWLEWVCRVPPPREGKNAGQV